MDNLHKPTSCAALSYFRVPSLALRAIHLVPRLRRVADLCSSTVSEMRICGYNAEEKILCRTPFPAYAVYHLHPSYPYKGNGCSKRVALIKSAHGAGKRFSSLRANRRCLPFCPLSWTRQTSPPPQRRNPRPEMANHLRSSGTPENLCLRPVQPG